VLCITDPKVCILRHCQWACRAIIDISILSSKSRRIYTGLTSNLFRRILQHKRGEIEGFTQHYRINRLVYYHAIHREKVIKGWLREKKIALIERDNPTWDDLAEDWRNPLPKLNVLPGGEKAGPSAASGLRMTTKK